MATRRPVPVDLLPCSPCSMCSRRRPGRAALQYYLGWVGGWGSVVRRRRPMTTPRATKKPAAGGRRRPRTKPARSEGGTGTFHAGTERGLLVKQYDKSVMLHAECDKVSVSLPFDVANCVQHNGAFIGLFHTLARSVPAWNVLPPRSLRASSLPSLCKSHGFNSPYYYDYV